MAYHRWLRFTLLSLLGACHSTQRSGSAEPQANTVPARPDSTGEGAALSQDEILAASDLPATLAQPVSDDPSHTQIFRLSNGLTVYISPSQKEPSFEARIVARTGSRNDPPDSTGLAHYLEHMLFKGTTQLGALDYAKESKVLEETARQYDRLRDAKSESERQEILQKIDALTQQDSKLVVPNELMRVYEALGITDVNAYTSIDETVYQAKVPSHQFSNWLKIEAERFQRPVFRLFYPELEAVYEEKNRSLDNPGTRANDAMMELLFPEHPYGTQTTIGTLEHLKTPAFADMIAYFKRWYRPNNMAIILAGDIDPASVIPELEAAFGAWDPKLLPDPKSLPGKVVALKERQVETVVGPGSRSVTIAWPLVPFGHPDEAALSVMDLLVDSSRAGAFNRLLLDTHKLPGGGSYPLFAHEAGLWTMHATARDEQSLQEVEALLMTVVDDVLAGNFNDEDMKAVVLASEIHDQMRLEDNASRVAQMVEAFVNRIEWPDYVKRTQELAAVTRDDVLRVAKKYLGEGRAVVYRDRGQFKAPSISKPKITPLAIEPAQISAFAKDMLNRPVPELQPKWVVAEEHYQLEKYPSGDVIATKNTENRLFSVYLHYEWGSRERTLLCQATRVLDHAGAGELAPTAFQDALFRHGASLAIHCSPNGTGILVSGADSHFDDTMQLVWSWLDKPNVDPKSLPQIAQNVVSQRRSAVEQPSTLADALRDYAMYGSDSTYLIVASNRDLERANWPRLRRELKTLMTVERTTLYYGPRDPASLVDALRLNKKARRSGVVPPGDIRVVKKPSVYYLAGDAAQAQLMAVYRDEPLPIGRRALAKWLSAYFTSGMSGVVFQEVREARGLAYSASGYYRVSGRPKDDTGLRFDVGTQPDKVSDVMKLVQILGSRDLHEARKDSAKASLLRRFRDQRVVPRDVPWSVLMWRRQGLDGDPGPREFADLQEVQSGDLDRFFHEVVNVPVLWAIYGDPARVGIDALRSEYEFIEVRSEQLFGYGFKPAEREAPQKPKFRSVAKPDARSNVGN